MENKAKKYEEMSLLDFQKKFPNEQACWDYFYKIRWPEAYVCENCQSKANCIISNRKVIQCNSCKKQKSITTGTIFHKSRTPLLKWFWTIYFMATSKKGVSVLYLQKQLSIKSYRTMWLMTHKIRHAMACRDALYSLKGIVETDEIFIGGKQSFDERREHGNNKTSFLIMVQENDNHGGPRFLTFEELESIYDEHVIPAIQKNIVKGSVLKTDGASPYVKAKEKGYKNDRVVVTDNPEKGHEHMKWVNLITSNLKRYLLSTHHGVFPKYRKSFLAEFAYRFNRRFWSNQAFDRLLYACIYCDPTSLDELTD